MANAKVYVYLDGKTLRVSPPVIGVEGGKKLHLFNATEQELTATFPPESVNAKDPAKKLRPKRMEKIEVRAQGTVEAFTYTVAPAKGAKAKANSDPVLIVEN